MRRLIGGWTIFKGTGYMVRGYFLTFSYLPSSQWVSTFKGEMIDELPLLNLLSKLLFVYVGLILIKYCKTFF